MSDSDELYRKAVATFGAALGRLARAYEADPDKRHYWSSASRPLSSWFIMGGATRDLSSIQRTRILQASKASEFVSIRPDVGGVPGIGFYRAQLERQIDFLREDYSDVLLVLFFGLLFLFNVKSYPMIVLPAAVLFVAGALYVPPVIDGRQLMCHHVTREGNIDQGAASPHRSVGAKHTQVRPDFNT